MNYRSCAILTEMLVQTPHGLVNESWTF